MPLRHGIARTLRRQSTDAEQCLWMRLRNRQLADCKFRRQQPLGPYVVDFCCQERRLVIELDGGQHADRVEKDQERERQMAEAGFQTLRFWNNDVLNPAFAALTASDFEVITLGYVPPSPPTNLRIK